MSADLTIPRDLLAAMQSSIATALTLRGAIWRAQVDGSGRFLVRDQVPCNVYTPGSPQSVQVLSDLGGARASRVGAVAVGTDAQEGDELRIGGTHYIMERVVTHPEMIYLALSELKP